jgi:hypothetical protein
MELRYSAASGGQDGLLPDARHQLAVTISRLERLGDETAWECAAAREYRTSLEALVGELRGLRHEALELELDVRSVWLPVGAGAW